MQRSQIEDLKKGGLTEKLLKFFDIANQLKKLTIQNVFQKLQKTSNLVVTKKSNSLLYSCIVQLDYIHCYIYGKLM